MQIKYYIILEKYMLDTSVHAYNSLLKKFKNKEIFNFLKLLFCHRNQEIDLGRLNFYFYFHFSDMKRVQNIKFQKLASRTREYDFLMSFLKTSYQFLFITCILTKHQYHAIRNRLDYIFIFCTLWGKISIISRSTSIVMTLCKSKSKKT